jgi:3-deoxy-D-manno-octulosonic-acid transferase
MIEWTLAQCRARQLQACRFSDWQQNKLMEPVNQNWVIIVDGMGLLAEIYCCGNIAFVGGALHHQVHNVLEPSVRGLYVAFGPRFYNSQEARLLISEKLVKSFDNEQGLTAWWKQLILDEANLNQDLLKRVHSLGGASNKIISSLSLLRQDD